MDKGNHSVETGYDLHSAFWRQGLMTEALTTVINFAYSDQFFFYLNRIQALTYVAHRASIGLLLKLGFQEEGLRREAGYWENQYHDLRSFSLLRRDWQSDIQKWFRTEEYSHESIPYLQDHCFENTLSPGFGRGISPPGCPSRTVPFF
jgi:hypothetical protein